MLVLSLPMSPTHVCKFGALCLACLTCSTFFGLQIGSAYAANMAPQGLVTANFAPQPAPKKDTLIREDGLRSVVLAVLINGLTVDTGTIFLSDNANRMLVTRAFLGTYHFNVVAQAREMVDGIEYFNLAKIPKLSFVWNRERSEISIVAGADSFAKNKLNIGAASRSMNAPSKYSPGAFLNYDLDFTHSVGGVTKNALFDFGVFRNVGLLTSNFSLHERKMTRLMTSYSVDDTENLKTLKFGDAVNNTGSWGRALLYGGLQYSSNFSIRPDFISVAMPSISGKAILPSTVDVYVNNTLRTRQNVDVGPFSIQNLPLITGTGEVQLVVKDLLGREQVITQNFFASPILLRSGLVEDAYDLGWVRKNYATASNEYLDPFFSMNYRKGISDTWTSEGRLELQRQILTAGLSVSTALSALNSTVETSVVTSRDGSNLENGPIKTGESASATWSYLGKKWSANAKLQYNTPAFRQLGSDAAHLLQRLATAQLNVPWGRGILAVNYFQQKNYAEPAVRLLNLAYSLSLNQKMYASALAVKSFGIVPSLFVGVGLTLIIDARHFASANTRISRETKALYADYQQSTPHDRGIGYRLAAQLGAGQARQEASLTMNQSYGGLQADVVNQSGAVSERFGLQGGINFLAGDVYFSRGFDDAFAVVQTEGLKNIPIYLENQEVARTNQQGKAIVSNLQSYQNNRISIDPFSLPMEASLEKMEKIVVPRFRGGAVVDFQVQTVRAATLMLELENGEPIPTWSTVTVNGLERKFVSGRRGEVYVEFLQQKKNTVNVTMVDGRICAAVVDLPDDAEAIPFLEHIRCIALH